MRATRSKGKKNLDSIISKLKIHTPQEVVDSDDESNTPAEEQKARINESLDGTGEADKRNKRSKRKPGRVLRYRNEDNTDLKEAEDIRSFAENHTPHEDNHDDKDILPKTIFEELPNGEADFEEGEDTTVLFLPSEELQVRAGPSDDLCYGDLLNEHEDDDGQETIREKGKKKKKKKVQTYESDDSLDDDGLPRRVSCTGCGRKVNPVHGTILRHPILNVLVCKKCNQYYNSGPFTRDEYGIEEQCRWCGDGGDLICCDKCEKVFCKTCLKRNCGKTYLKNLMNAPDDFKWLCIVCNMDKPQKHIQRLRKRCDLVMEALDRLKAKKAHFKSKKGKQPSGLIGPTTLERRSRLNCLSEGLGSKGEGFSSSGESPVKKTFPKQDLPAKLFSKSESDEEKEMVDETEEKETEVKENGTNEELDARSDKDEKEMVDKTEKKETKGKENRKNEDHDVISEDEKELEDKTKEKKTEGKGNRKNEDHYLISDEDEKELKDKTEEKETEGKGNRKNEEVDVISEDEKELEGKTEEKETDEKENETNEWLDARSDEEKEMVEKTNEKETEVKESGKNEVHDVISDGDEKEMVNKSVEKETEGKENGKSEVHNVLCDEDEKEMVDKSEEKETEGKESGKNEESGGEREERQEEEGNKVATNKPDSYVSDSSKDDLAESIFESQSEEKETEGKESGKNKESGDEGEERQEEEEGNKVATNKSDSYVSDSSKDDLAESIFESQSEEKETEGKESGKNKESGDEGEERQEEEEGNKVATNKSDSYVSDRSKDDLTESTVELQSGEENQSSVEEERTRRRTLRKTKLNTESRSGEVAKLDKNVKNRREREKEDEDADSKSSKSSEKKRTRSQRKVAEMDRETKEKSKRSSTRNKQSTDPKKTSKTSSEEQETDVEIKSEDPESDESQRKATKMDSETKEKSKRTSTRNKQSTDSKKTSKTSSEEQETDVEIKSEDPESDESQRKATKMDSETKEKPKRTSTRNKQSTDPKKTNKKSTGEKETEVQIKSEDPESDESPVVHRLTRSRKKQAKTSDESKDSSEKETENSSKQVTEESSCEETTKKRLSKGRTTRTVGMARKVQKQEPVDDDQDSSDVAPNRRLTRQSIDKTNKTAPSKQIGGKKTRKPREVILIDDSSDEEITHAKKTPEKKTSSKKGRKEVGESKGKKVNGSAEVEDRPLRSKGKRNDMKSAKVKREAQPSSSSESSDQETKNNSRRNRRNQKKDEVSSKEKTDSESCNSDEEISLQKVRQRARRAKLTMEADFSSDSDFESKSPRNTALQNKNHIEESSDSDENLFGSMVDEIDQVKTEAQENEYNLDQSSSNESSSESDDSAESGPRSKARTAMLKHTRKRPRPVTSSSESEQDSSAKSDSSSGIARRTRKRREIESDLSDVGTSRKRKKNKKIKTKKDQHRNKKRSRKLLESEESESESDAKVSEEESESSSESEPEPTRKSSRLKQTRKQVKKKKGSKASAPAKKKKRRVRKNKSDSDDDDEEDEGKSPSKGRRKIRKLLADEKLGEETRKARRLEEERRKRLLERTRTLEDEETPKESWHINSLILEENEETEEVLVEVHHELLQHLKPHQAKGIQFMYDNVVDSIKAYKKGDAGNGCILAHCMGLGKTLQVVALIHTLFNNKHLDFTTALIIAPLNTVLNWQVEFDKWLSVDERIDVYILKDAGSDNWRRADMLKQWKRFGGVMILGYDMYRNMSICKHTRSKHQKKIFKESILDPGPDIVVCDEGHVLRNDQSAISKSVNAIKTRRRVVLTGTPLQNNLTEYHCMISFVKPSLLGTRREFMNAFGNPILNGQCADSTVIDVRLMKQRCHVLFKLLEGCVQRRDYSVLTPFLPPKHEYVIKIRLSETQRKLYDHYFKTFVYPDGDMARRGASLFSDYQALMRIWTHPWCLKLEAIRRSLRATFDDSDESLDGFVVHSDEEEEESDHSSLSYKSSNTEGEKPSSEKTKNKEENGVFVLDSSSEEESSANTSDEEVMPQPSRRSTRNAIAKSESVRQVVDADAGKEREDDPLGESNTRSGALFKEDVPEEKEWYDEFLTDEDEYNVELSGKLTLLLEILADAEAVEEKVLVFSQSLVTLDLIERALGGGDVGGDRENWCRGCDYFRMDGSTSVHLRQRWSDIFNDVDNKTARLFLISTKAGGLGINLVAANRVIVFDVSWNPSHDVQSIFRVFRFGQTRPVYVYRLVTQGTMEERIYDRQVAKLSISERVIDKHQVERHFTAADLSELYTFNPSVYDEEKDKENIPKLPLPKDAVLADIINRMHPKWIVKYHEHDSLLQNLVEEQLTDEECKVAWSAYEAQKDQAKNQAHARALQAMYAQQQLQQQGQAIPSQNSQYNNTLLQEMQHLQQQQLSERMSRFQADALLLQQQRQRFMSSQVPTIGLQQPGIEQNRHQLLQHIGASQPIYQARNTGAQGQPRFQPMMNYLSQQQQQQQQRHLIQQPMQQNQVISPIVQPPQTRPPTQPTTTATMPIIPHGTQYRM